MNEYIVGLLVGVAVAACGALAGLDRGRSFYPTVMIVIASYYVLFAAMGASNKVLIEEVAVGVAFSALALFGFKRNLWLVAAAIAGHGVFDLFHHLLITNPGMPLWWPGFCASADLSIGGWMGFRLLRSPLLSHGSDD